MIKQKHLKYIFNRINKKYDKDILINFGNIIGCLTTDNKLYIYKKCKWTVNIIPYDEQVETLFNDLHTACSVNKDMYYIGGVILVKNKWNNGYSIWRWRNARNDANYSIG